MDPSECSSATIGLSDVYKTHASEDRFDEISGWKVVINDQNSDILE